MAKRSKRETGTVLVPSGNEFSRERLKKIFDRVKIELRATQAGQRNEPPTNASVPDENERQIIDESHGFLGAASREAKARLTEILNTLHAMKFQAADVALHEADMRRKAMEANDQHAAYLLRAAKDRHHYHRLLRAFEELNKLSPLSAVYGRDSMMFWTYVAALTLAEGFINAFFFQELQDRGIVGGFLLALGTGAANVALGLGTGFIGWRLLAHVKKAYRLLGLFTTTTFMSAAFALHLALGRLREVITYDPNAKIDFLVILRPSDWFAYTTVPPAVLFALGVATFLIAAIKGRGGRHGIVAPYWGHDGHDRRFRAADEALQEATEDLKAAIQNAYDGERAAIRKRHTADRTTLDAMRQHLADGHAVARTFGDSIGEEISRSHIWLQSYRAANRAVRDTPPPAYFDTYPAFEEWQHHRLDVTELDAVVAESEAILAENATKLAALEERTLNTQAATIEEIVRQIASQSERAERENLHETKRRSSSLDDDGGNVPQPA